jgi:hypothetical protein
MAGKASKFHTQGFCARFHALNKGGILIAWRTQPKLLLGYSDCWCDSRHIMYLAGMVRTTHKKTQRELINISK